MLRLRRPELSSDVDPGLTAPSGSRCSSGRNVGVSSRRGAALARRRTAPCRPRCPTDPRACCWGGIGGLGRARLRGGRRHRRVPEGGSGAGPPAHDGGRYAEQFSVFTVGAIAFRSGDGTLRCWSRAPCPKGASTCPVQHLQRDCSTGHRLTEEVSSPFPLCASLRLPPGLQLWRCRVARCMTGVEVPPTHSYSLQSLAIFNKRAHASPDPADS